MPAVMTGQAVENQFDDHIDQEIQDRCRQKDPDLTVASVLGNDLVRPAHDIHNTNDIGCGGPFQKIDLQVFQVRKRDLHGQRSDHMAKALPAAVADGISRLDLILVNGFISAPEGLGNEAGKVTGLEEQIKELQEKKAYLFGEVEPEGVPQSTPSFFGTGAPGKPSNLNAFGSKTPHEGDFGKLLGQKVTEEKQQIDSDYFFK